MRWVRQVDVVRWATRRLKTLPPAYRLARRVQTRVNSSLPPRRVGGIDGRVHRNDLMFHAVVRSRRVEEYGEQGLQAVRQVEAALASAGRDAADVHCILDLGCGYGRVMRHLRLRFPDAELVACELDAEAVSFCAKEFAATPLLSRPSLHDVPFGSYDLVWAGSLVTHLPPEGWRAFAEVVPRILRPGGVAVFTTHGPACLERLESYAPGLGAGREAMARVLAEDGYAYRRYSHYGPGDDYGIALHTRSAVVETMSAVAQDVRLVSHVAAGWTGHQDVYAFLREERAVHPAQ